MSVSPARLAANRSNAQKSTGPRTAGGKERSKRNGLTHGLFCNDVVMPGESRKQFAAFRELFLLDLKPSDSAECMLVDRIVIANWKLKRLNRIEAVINRGYAERAAEAKNREVAGSESPVEPREIPSEVSQAMMFLDEASSAVERIERHTNRLELSIHRALRELAKLKKRTQQEREEVDPENSYLPAVTDSAAVDEGSVVSAGNQVADTVEDQRIAVGGAGRDGVVEDRAIREEKRSLRSRLNVGNPLPDGESDAGLTHLGRVRALDENPSGKRG